ncbi:MAG: TonB-dependent receptor [Pseudomonadota bacterium]
MQLKATHRGARQRTGSTSFFVLALMLFTGGVFAADDGALLISIEAQPMEQALEAFSEQTRRQITVDTRAITDMQSAGVRGTLSPEEALRQLVAGSGLEIVQINQQDFALRPASVADPRYATPDIGVEEVIVRGENIQRSLLDTNTSVNVQTEEDIIRSNDKRLSEVFSRAANVNVNGAGIQAFSFSVRGINSSGVGGAGSAQVASLMVDGAAFTTQQLARGFNTLFDVQQVEMLRGPQSTAQARNSLAGGVVVSTNDPEFEQRTTGIAGFGNYGTYELAIANTGGITDELAYRVTVQRLSSDGFINNPVIGTDAYSFSDTDTFRGKLLYRSSAIPLEVLLSHTHVAADARNDASAWFPEERRFRNSNPFGDGGMESDQDVTTLKLSYELSNELSVEWQTAYNEFLSEDLNSNYATTLPDRDRAWFATADQEEINHTLRLTYEGDRVRGSAGLFYSDETNRAIRDGVAFPNFQSSGLDLDLVTDAPLETTTEALFGEFDIRLSDALTLTLGARYERVDLNSVTSTTASLNLPPPAPFIPVVPLIPGIALDASTDFAELLPKIALTYAVDEHQRVGFTYSEGYRQGGVTFDQLTFAAVEYDPEYVNNYELSYKSQFENGLSVNANLFYLEWNDQQVNDQEPGNPISIVLNAGESTVYGTELEVAWRNEQWDTYAALGYVNTEFDRFTTNNVDFTGNSFPNAPELTAAIGAFYTIGNLTLGAEANYRDGFFTRPNNDVKTEALTIVDLSADYQMGEITVRGYVNNVLDDFELIAEPFVVEGIDQGSFSPPRTYGVQVMYGF